MQSGITLVALVVTIVVLLILAGVSISLVLGNNGIITKTQATKYKQQVATMKEELELYIGDKTIETSGSYDSTKLSATINSLVYNGVAQTGETIKNILTTETDDVLANYSVAKGELKYLGDDSTEASLFAQVIYNDSSIKVASAQSSTGIVTVSDAKEGTLEDYKIYGASVQNGTPTPSNPVDVVSLGENSKNIIDLKEFKTYSNWGTQFNFGSYPTKDGNKGFILNCEPNKQYTISFSSDTFTKNYLYICKTNGIDTTSRIAYLTTNSLINTKYTFSIADGEIAYLRMASTNTEEIFNSMINDMTWIQLEEGSTATEYKPYKYIDVISSGKNLLQKTSRISFTKTDYHNLTGTINQNGSIHVSGTINNTTNNDLFVNVYMYPDKAFYLPAGTYYIGHNLTAQVNGYNKTNVLSIDSPATITSSYRFWTVASGQQLIVDEVIYPQIEKGTTATAYEPYYESVVNTIDLAGHEPLRKIGDVADYIDYKNQRIIRNIGKIVLDGTETIQKNADYGDYKSFYIINSNYNIKGEQSSLCTHVPFCVWTPPAGNYWWSATGSSGIRINKKFLTNYDSLSSDEQRIQAIKNWLSSQYTFGTPVTVYYPLITPTYEYINLPTISTYNGTTNIYVTNSSGINASNISISYIQK